MGAHVWGFKVPENVRMFLIENGVIAIERLAAALLLHRP